MHNLCSLLRHRLVFSRFGSVWIFWLVCVGLVKLFHLFCPDSEVVFVFSSHMKIVADLHNLPAASPKSYFTGLPLLRQPSEPGIIQPQHVAAMKWRTAVSGFIINRCSEQKQQNLKSEAGFKCNRKMSQLKSAGRNSIKDRVSLDCRDDWPLHPRWMSRLSCTQQFFCGYFFLVILLNAWLQRCCMTGIEEALFGNGLLSAFMCHFAVNWGSYWDCVTARGKKWSACNSAQSLDTVHIKLLLCLNYWLLLRRELYGQKRETLPVPVASFGRPQSQHHHVSVKITGDDSNRPKPDIYSRHRRGQHRRNTRPYLIISHPSASGKQSCSRSGSDEFPINTLSFEPNFWVAVSWLAGLQLQSGLPGDTFTH